MNWGKSIVIVFILFAAMIITMVVKSMRQNFDLVDDNYYEKELVFQDQIDATANAATFAGAIQFSKSQNTVVLTMPAEGLKNFTDGQIIFYRPSDATLDITENMKPDTTGIQKFELGKFRSGAYQVKMTWSANGKKFYHESYLQI